MKKNIGAGFKALWRLKPGPFVDDMEFGWSTGKVYSFDAEKDLLAVLYETESYDLFPFPHDDVDYAEVKLVRDVMPKPSAKRERESTEASPIPPMSAQMAEFTHALLDGKAQKATQNVEGGEGLRIPASIQAKFHCLHPTVWWQRLAKGEDAEALAKQWKEQFTSLQAHLGAAQPPTEQRDPIEYQAKIAVASIKQPLTDRPKDLAGWTHAFMAPLAWLRLVIEVAHSAQVAATLHASALSALKKAGLLDLADLIATAEERAPKEKGGDDFRPSATVLNQIKQFVHTAVTAAQDNAPRGRGWGKGRGGYRGAGL